MFFIISVGFQSSVQWLHAEKGELIFQVIFPEVGSKGFIKTRICYLCFATFSVLYTPPLRCTRLVFLHKIQEHSDLKVKGPECSVKNNTSLMLFTSLQGKEKGRDVRLLLETQPFQYKASIISIVWFSVWFCILS